MFSITNVINFPKGSLGPSWGAPPTFGPLPGPSWNPTGAVQKKTLFCLIITKTTIFVLFGAHKLKPQDLQNTASQFRGRSLEPSGRGTFLLWPPWAPPKPPLEPQRLPQSKTHMSCQGLHQTCKVYMLETLEISSFGSHHVKKGIPGQSLTPRKLSRDLKKWAPIFGWSSRGAQNAPRTLRGSSQGLPKTTQNHPMNL